MSKIRTDKKPYGLEVSEILLPYSHSLYYFWVLLCTSAAGNRTTDSGIFKFKSDDAAIDHVKVLQKNGMSLSQSNVYYLSLKLEIPFLNNNLSTFFQLFRKKIACFFKAFFLYSGKYWKFSLKKRIFINCIYQLFIYRSCYLE